MLVMAALLLMLVGSAHAAFQGDNVGCALNAQSASIDEVGELLPGGTGNPSLDQGIQNDIIEIQRLFGVAAKMFLIRESGGPNAFALSTQHPAEGEILRHYNLPPQAAPDGVVVFGVDLMTSEYNDSGFHTGYGIPSIIGHEYGHIMQFKNRFPLHGKWIELHADYMAGWFTAHRARHDPQQNVRESENSFFNKGDYAFNDPSHHGTPAERLAAFMAGLNLNLQSNVSDGRRAYDQGILYLRSQGAN
jgi:hypothetical protein